MSNLEIFCWASGGGFALMVAFWLIMLGASICRWATAFIEDLDHDKHQNWLQKKFMSIWGLEWHEEEKFWYTLEEPNCPHEKKWMWPKKGGGYEQAFVASLWGNCIVFGFIGWAVIFALGICLILWKIALPIVLFFLLILLARHLRRKVKAKAAEPEKTETEKELEKRYPS